MAKHLLAYDDIYVKTRDLSNLTGPTVIALAHNEMYFLPSWLAHYRKLGAERFIVLDDASTDDTLAYLSAQPDVMVVGSHRRYGEQVPVLDRSDPTGRSVEMRRMAHVWRMILPERFSMNRWVVQATLDEFLVLPQGRSLACVFKDLDRQQFDAVSGTLLDVYPKDIATMRDQATESAFDPSAEWFFDAISHRIMQQNAPPLFRYYGSRSRIKYDYYHAPRMSFGGRLRFNLRDWIRRLRGKTPLRKSGNINKFCLVRWRTGTWMKSAHKTSLAVSPNHLLPILHMRFTGDFYRRAEVAIREKSYDRNSQGYVEMVETLQEMERRNASFPPSVREVVASSDAESVF